jgi:hypothetical protein
MYANVIRHEIKDTHCASARTIRTDRWLWSNEGDVPPQLNWLTEARATKENACGLAPIVGRQKLRRVLIAFSTQRRAHA